MLAPASVIFAKDKPEKFLAAAPIKLNRDGEKWAEKTLKSLSLEEKVGQLFLIWVRAQCLNVEDPIFLQLRDRSISITSVVRDDGQCRRPNPFAKPAV
jgi:hypothetical protein